MKNKKTKIIYLSLTILFIFIPLKIVSALSAIDTVYCQHDAVLKECNWFPGQCPTGWKNVESPVGVSEFPAAPSGEYKLLGCISTNPKTDHYPDYTFENANNPLKMCNNWIDSPTNSVKQISGIGYPDFCLYPIISGGSAISCDNYITADDEMLFECLKSESIVPYLFCCPPPSCSISASPSSITSGQSSTLTWSSKSADSVTPFGFTASTLSGSTSVSPSATTTYKLTVQNSKGQTASCETIIIVKESPKPPPVISISGPCQKLVPCKDDCKLSDIFVMIQNIVNCLVFISTIICLLFLVIGGLLYIFSLGNPENLTKAKNTILWALGGLALVFLAWLIVNTVMYWMGVDQSFLMWNRTG